MSGASVGEMTVLDLIGKTPLVPLRSLAQGLAQPVLVKCEHLNPGGSVKDRIAKAIVEDAEGRGQLKPGATIIEATAGNTGVGLAIAAAPWRAIGAADSAELRQFRPTQSQRSGALLPRPRRYRGGGAGTRRAGR